MTGTGGDETPGLTKDAGWELGVRATVPAPLPEVWAWLLGPGLPIWLGDIAALPTEKGAAYVTADGVRGTIRSFTPDSRVRLGWQPADWPHETVLQLTVKEAVTGTTIGFHQEQLADREERKLLLGHWKAVVATISAQFAG
ncbi:MAG: SRPBCC domain-containing protein [Rhodoglobus sp.]